jgi:hypothetical protein
LFEIAIKNLATDLKSRHIKELYKEFITKKKDGKLDNKPIDELIEE